MEDKAKELILALGKTLNCRTTEDVKNAIKELEEKLKSLEIEFPKLNNFNIGDIAKVSSFVPELKGELVEILDIEPNDKLYAYVKFLNGPDKGKNIVLHIVMLEKQTTH